MKIVMKIAELADVRRTECDTHLVIIEDGIESTKRNPSLRLKTISKKE